MSRKPRKIRANAAREGERAKLSQQHESERFMVQRTSRHRCEFAPTSSQKSRRTFAAPLGQPESPPAARKDRTAAEILRTDSAEKLRWQSFCGGSRGQKRRAKSIRSNEPNRRDHSPH